MQTEPVTEETEKIETCEITLSDIAKLPMSLKIVAGLFILDGIKAAIEFFITLIQGGFDFNLNLLSLFIGYGLLTLNSTWRIVAIIALCIGIAIEGGTCAYLVTSPDQLEIEILGRPIGHTSLIILTAFLCLLFLWMYLILKRSKTKELYKK
jgi:hypothetical protein